MSYDIPTRFVIVSDNVVIGQATVYAEGVVISGPPGTETIWTPMDSPITYGWRHIFNEDEEKYYWLPPLPSPAETLQAGNGNPPPPG